MADCRIVNAGVVTAVNNIKEISNSYKTDGQAFIDALTSAISAMEGETKDALQKFFTTDVQKFVTEDLPNAINGMSELLEANRKNFEDVDLQIANSIAGN
ncbi:MAG: hypothetical protein HFH91_02735 [Lachnospiraceae bacterium]|nr:hypothetical protein [Lachnospiraceae bacterium]